MIDAGDTGALLTSLTQMGVRFQGRGVRLVLDAPRGLLTPTIALQLRQSKVRLLSALRMAAPCDKCGRTEDIDRPIHGGRSVRRDCAACGRTKGFPIWNPHSHGGSNVRLGSEGGERTRSKDAYR